LQPIARQLGLTLAQLALAWCLRHWQLGCVITGATRPEQVRENCGAAGVKLDQQVLDQIEAVLGSTDQDAAR
ncbi:MAG: aldo/keto reductase, partial [Phycisphaerae bacterium]